MTTAGKPARRPAVRVDVRQFWDVTDAEMEEWRRLQAKANAPEEARMGSDLTWAKLEPTDYFIRLWADGGLRACAWLTRRRIAVGGRDAPVAGVRGEMTHPAYRRLGLGRIVMERTHDLMRSLEDCEFGVLFSSAMAVPFYESLGWRSIDGAVMCDQPDGRINYTRRLPTAPVMVRMKEPRIAPPSGVVDVLGLPW
jgi:GNAT superfamily N-acetyltransferase